MITEDEIAELAPYYEEYVHGLDPDSPSVNQARMIYFSICKKVYDREPPEVREKFDLTIYIATFITEELLRYLKQRTSKFPTIQPEKKAH